MSEIKYVDSVALKKFWELAKEKMLDLVYPVGSVYMSFNNTYPGTLFGGNWTPIEGRFLLATDGVHEVGSTGDGKLTTDNIPEFTGKLTAGISNYGVFRRYYTNNSGEDIDLITGVFSADDGTSTSYRFANGTSTVNEDTWYRSVDFNLGNASPTPIYPPYIAVYMWRRMENNTATFTLDQSKLDDTTQILA